LTSEIGLAERVENPCVGGSIPPRATNKLSSPLKSQKSWIPLKTEGVNNLEMLTNLLMPHNKPCREPLEDTFHSNSLQYITSKEFFKTVFVKKVHYKLMPMFNLNVSFQVKGVAI
jgi:hypothetical protein